MTNQRMINLIFLQITHQWSLFSLHGSLLRTFRFRSSCSVSQAGTYLVTCLQVVQKMVGFSPKQVNNALAKTNSQEAREMKSNMKRFQAFLKKFEV